MTFVTDVQKKHRNLALLVEIALTQPAAKTLYFTNRGGLYGSTYYEERLLDYGTSAQRADPMTGEVVPMTGSITLQNAHISAQTVAERLGHMLQDYAFAGAAVTVKIWNMDTATNAVVFTGYIENIDEYTDEAITFNLGEQQKFDIVIPPTAIDPGAFPEAPNENYGKRVGLCYGTFHQDDNGATGLNCYRGACFPALCIDKVGPDHGRPVIRVCDNDGTSAAHTLPTNCLLYWDSAVNEVGYLFEDRYSTVTNSTTKVEAEFDADPYGSISVIPITISADDTSTNPGNAMDRNGSTYATIVDAQILSLGLPSWSNIGAMAEIRLCLYTLGTGESGTVQFGLWDQVSDAYYQSATQLLDGTAKNVFMTVTTITAAWRDWRFVETSGSTDIPVEVRAEMTSDTGTCKIKAMTLAIDYTLNKDFRVVDITYPSWWMTPTRLRNAWRR